MNPIELITQGFRFLAETLGLIKKRSDLNNTEEMKKRDILQKGTQQDDEDHHDIKNADINNVRNKLS